ncbi:MAG: hypothetical protein JW940_00875 [Polyangiaceae bacterium]|nr:hypothetical protein [Polyangiaceae bacterium]
MRTLLLRAAVLGALGMACGARTELSAEQHDGGGAPVASGGLGSGGAATGGVNGFAGGMGQGGEGNAPLGGSAAVGGAAGMQQGARGGVAAGEDAGGRGGALAGAGGAGVRADGGAPRGAGGAPASSGARNGGETGTSPRVPGIVVAPSGPLVVTEAGAEVTVRVVLTSALTHPATIEVSSSDPTEGVVRPERLVFGTDDWDQWQSFVIQGVDDGVPDLPQTFQVVLARLVTDDPAYALLKPPDLSVQNWEIFEVVGPGSAAFGGRQLSGNGRFLVYETHDDEIMLHDRSDRSTRRVDDPAIEGASNPRISGDGRYVVYDAGPGSSRNAYVFDRLLEETHGVSVTASGGFGVDRDARPMPSYDGRFIAFVSDSQNLYPTPHSSQGEILLRDTSLGLNTLISVASDGGLANDYATLSSLSDDGRFVVFQSVATNIVPGKPQRRHDVYLRDLQAQSTVVAGRSLDGGYPNSYALLGAFSGNGQVVTFSSFASDIVDGDDADTFDAFAWDRSTDMVARINPVPLADDSHYALTDVSRDGRYIAFNSAAAGMVTGDTNGTSDVFVLDRTHDNLVRRSHGLHGEELSRNSGGASLSDDGKIVMFSTDSPEITGSTAAAGYVVVSVVP